MRCDNANSPKFIDLFCGIGGMQLAFESAGAQCVFSSDWDKYAQITYEANFGEKPHGDLRAIASDDLPPTTFSSQGSRVSHSQFRASARRISFYWKVNDD